MEILGVTRALAAAVLVLLAAVAPACAQTESLEAAIKATYLYKLAPFVEWPPGSFASDGSPVNLCIVADPTFADLLEQAVQGQRINRRPFAVRRLPAADPRGCHIIFVGTDRAAALEMMRGAPVLTVTDAALDQTAKGIVNFVTRDNKVRFEIDDIGAAENHLEISSKLLSLAVAVRTRARSAP